MTLFIANSTRAGGEVQMPLWQWRAVLERMAINTAYRGLAATIAGKLPAGDGPGVVRVWLTTAQITELEAAMAWQPAAGRRGR